MEECSDEHIGGEGGLRHGQVYSSASGRHCGRPTISSTMNKKQLVDLCSAYHLPYSGKKAKLKAHLWAFSSDRKKWESLVPGAHKYHKEPQSLSHSKQSGCPAQKLSLLRQELLFASTADRLRENCHQLPTGRSEDHRTPEEKRAVLEWVMLPLVYPSIDSY
ncbi:hypothetical protein BJV74DRAFT_798535 [Russula compacta]|nr:hypothetical protein BJV74DRAFT_798535 [Russula compacta]